MEKYFRVTPVLIFSFFLIFGNSCQKWRDNREVFTSENHTLSEAGFNEILRHFFIAVSPEGALLTDSCFNFSKSGDSLLIDLGEVGCKGLFNFAVHGKLMVVFSDSFHLQGAVAAISLIDFYSRGYRVEGQIALTNLGISADGNPHYELRVDNGFITAEKENTGEEFVISWLCEYTYELVEKNNAVFSFDDLYKITGSASGINEDGRTYTAEIITPLLKYNDCRWVGSGKTKIAANDLRERSLFYGEDCTLESTCCDNVAIEEVKGQDRTVRMK